MILALRRVIKHFFFSPPQVGFEPTAKWLTAICSTAELLERKCHILKYNNIQRRIYVLDLVIASFNIALLKLYILAFTQQIKLISCELANIVVTHNEKQIDAKRYTLA